MYVVVRTEEELKVPGVPGMGIKETGKTLVSIIFPSEWSLYKRELNRFNEIEGEIPSECLFEKQNAVVLCDFCKLKLWMVRKAKETRGNPARYEVVKAVKAFKESYRMPDV